MTSASPDGSVSPPVSVLYLTNENMAHVALLRPFIPSLKKRSSR